MLIDPKHKPDDSALEPLLHAQVDKRAVESRGCIDWLRGIHFSRWQSFSGVCLYVSVVGTTYAFGIYSDLLKTNLGFTQNELDIIASVGNTGLYLSLLGGILLDRFGLHVAVYLGGFLIFIGFSYIWLAVKGYVPADIISVSVFFFLSQFGVCCHISSAVTVAVRLFPPEVRGSAVGLAKGYFGLSSAVLSDFSGGYFSNAKAAFLLFIAIAIPIIGSLGCSLANFIPQHALSFEFDERRGVNASLQLFFLHWISLFTVLFAVGYTQYAYEYTGWYSLIMPTLLAVTVLSILIIPSYYGDRVISHEDWTESNKYTAPHHSADKYDNLPLKNDPQGNTGPGSYFGSNPQGGNNRHGDVTDFSESDDERQIGHSPPDIRKVLPLKSDVPEFDVRVKVADRQGRKGFGSYGTLGKYGLGLGLGSGGLLESGKEDVESSRGFNKTVASSAFHNIEDDDEEDVDGGDGEGGEGHFIKREAPECFYGASIPLSQSVRTWRFWSLYITFLTICGTGLMVIDNINAIAEAVGRHPSDFFVALVSLANGAGRVSAGYASDKLSAYCSKLELLAIVAALMGLAQSMFAVGSAALLYPSLLLVGYLFGCSVSLLAVNVADIFGPRFVSTNFGAVDSAPILGSYLFVTGIVTLFYRTNYTDDGGDESCVGSQCFRIPFMINAVSCFSVAFLLHYMSLSTPMKRLHPTS